MSTRSSVRNLFPPLDNPELTIRRRPRVDPTLLNDFNMATNGNGNDGPPPNEGGDLPVPDLQTMEELYQPTSNGRGDVANKHLDKFLHVTQSIKMNGVTDDAVRLYLFPHSLTHHATAWFDRLPRNSITMFEHMAQMFLGKYFPPSMVTKLRNKITNLRQRPDESLFEAWEHYKLSIDRCPNHNMLPVTQIDTFYNRLTLRHRDTINVAAGGSFMKRRPEVCYDLIKNMIAHHNDWDTFVQRNSGTLLSNTITNPKEDLKGIITRSRNAYQGPTIPTTSSPPKVVECETDVTKDTVPPTNNGSTKYVQPPVVQIETQIPNSEPVVALVVEPVKAPVSTPKPTLKPSIPYPSRLHDQKLRDKANDQKEKFFQIFQDLNFSISFADALILMPKFGLTIKLVDFDADPRVPLIIGRSFLKIGRALIDVYAGELTLHVGNKAITFNLDQTSRYFANYDAMSINRIDVIDVACEKYSQELLRFSMSGSPTPSTEPIVSTSSPTLAPFGDSDFLLEETDAFLAINDEPILPKIDNSYYDSKGDILLEEFLNDDPSSPPLPPQSLTLLNQIMKNLLLMNHPWSNLKTYHLILNMHFWRVLKSHKQALAWQLSDIKGIDPEFCTNKILMEDDFKPAVQRQRKVNPKIHEVIKKEVLKLLDAGLIYPISDSPWLNDAIRKDHFPLPFMDQMLERLAGNKYYCFLDGFLVFMDDFSVFGNSFGTCLFHLDKMLKRCEDTNLCLNWEKSHFMVKEGIVLGHKISKNEIEVDKAKVDVIAKLHHPTTVKGIHSFLGHASFYRRFIQDFSMIARLMTRLLKKDTSFFFSKECIEAFQTLKKKLTKTPILIAPDWDLPFELMCDVSDFSIGAVLR
nr:hypothetical protein [Tanacetum cinerariifolium]